MGRSTIEDVARQAGVSIATVDRVLNGRAAVRPNTVERVEKAVRLLNYQPDRLAARLARGRDYRFCFVLPEGTNAYMIALGEAVRASAYSTTSSSFVAQSRTPIDGRSCGFFTSRSRAST